MTSDCKKQVKKISEKGKFLVGSVDILQNNTNSDFQENALEEYVKNGEGSNGHLNQVMELADFWFVKGHIICIYSYKPLMTFLITS